ncbi:Rho GTPase activation protein [Halteromyces radiatus]|uniref:Rho GTPase activation protein n=1 Tax=Halteromyces radiatus TaxID=101107 RepID=UPI0022209338|nr:Rho GTPase activation protein [Halteromyces radiatus]KAI8085164.1 Rho GTPase activation protein [Halteromyces radiatus]
MSFFQLLEYGFFLIVDTQLSPTTDTTPTLLPQQQQPPIITSRPSSSSQNLPELPLDWSFAYDDEGTIYYFNERTGESRWEPPTKGLEQKDQYQEESSQQHLSAPPPPPRTSSRKDLTTQEDLELENAFYQLDPEAMKKLALERLDQNNIRYQGYVQMKMVAIGGKLSSWKMYYAILLQGYLLLYKETHVKYRKKMTTIPPVGSFDLEGCQIDPAGKNDTKRKHSFMITIPPPRQKVTLYIQTANDNECAAWLDAIMRELIRRKEGKSQDIDILQLLRALTLDDKQMKVNKKMTKNMDTEDRQDIGVNVDGRPNKKLGWFSGNAKHKNPGTQVQTMDISHQGDNDIFGGFLYLDQDQYVPVVVRQCIEQVEMKGLDSVGIYRLSGPASTIQKYRTAYNRRELVDLAEEHDINVATGLLKLYFRELKNPLLTFEYYDWFIEAARISDYDDRMYQIKSIIHVLPKANFIVLEYLMRHLHRVAEHSDLNKMETSNLALIFSVGLLRTPQDDISSIMHTDLQSKIVEAIIQQVDWFFEVDEEV